LGIILLRVNAGLSLTIGVFAPIIAIAPLYHPYHDYRPKHVERPIQIAFFAENHTKKIAELIGYSLPEAYATIGQEVAVELCWKAQGHTEKPYAIFLHLIDASTVDRPTGPTILPSNDDRLTPLDADGQPLFAALPGPPILDPAIVLETSLAAAYTFDDSIILSEVTATRENDMLELDIQWQAKHAVNYNAVLWRGLK
jgi:hypothetical protein